MLRTAPRIKKPSVLGNGQHKVSIHSITELDDQLMIKFINPGGYYCAYWLISPALIKVLSKLSFIGGIPEGSKMKIEALIGLEYQINIVNNQLKTIK